MEPNPRYGPSPRAHRSRSGSPRCRFGDHEDVRLDAEVVGGPTRGAVAQCGPLRSQVARRLAARPARGAGAANRPNDMPRRSRATARRPSGTVCCAPAGAANCDVGGSGPSRSPAAPRRGLHCLPLAQRGADARGMPVVPGGLHRHVAQGRVAGLGDSPGALAGPAGMLARDQPHLRHQLARMVEARQVAKLRNQRGRSHQTGHALRLLDLNQRTVGAVGGPHRGQPGAIGLLPLADPGGRAHIPAQQAFRQPVPQPIGTRDGMCADQIP